MHGQQHYWYWMRAGSEHLSGHLYVDKGHQRQVRGQIVNVNCQEFYSFCKTAIKLAVAGNGGLTVKLDRGLVGQAGAVLPHPTMIQECGIKKRPWQWWGDPTSPGLECASPKWWSPVMRTQLTWSHVSGGHKTSGQEPVPTFRLAIRGWQLEVFAADCFSGKMWIWGEMLWVIGTWKPDDGRQWQVFKVTMVVK